MTFDAPTIALIAASATLALGVVALAALLLRRSGRAADELIAAAVSDMEARMEAMVRDLSEALERAEEESRRDRTLGGLVGAIDVDEVLHQTVAAAVELLRADAGLIGLAEAGPDSRPSVTAVGLAPDEEDLSGHGLRSPDGRLPRTVAFEYRYAPEQRDGREGLLHAGLSAPIVLEETVLGTVTVYTRDPDASFDDEAADELEELARRAAPAIESALRFREARRLADLDALTGLHNRRYFHETLEREVSRAHRYGRQLSLIVIDLDDFKRVNDRIGHLAGDAVLVEVAERMRSVVRAADAACRVGGDEFGIVLPESSLSDAEQLCRRIQHAVAVQPLRAGGTLAVSAGIAELEEGEDARAFFQRTDGALYRAKESGRGSVVDASSGSSATGIP